MTVGVEEEHLLPKGTSSLSWSLFVSRCLPPSSLALRLRHSLAHLSLSLLDWVKMTAVDKTDGVPAELPDQGDTQARTVWIGGLPTAAAENDAELKRDLSWFGAVQSISVRVKPGYRKSWALVTLVSLPLNKQHLYPPTQYATNWSTLSATLVLLPMNDATHLIRLSILTTHPV